MTETLPDALRIAAELVNAIGDKAAADAAAFCDAYRLGFEAGVEVGRQARDHELMAEDARLSEHIHDIAQIKPYAELERIRWDGRREDFGRPRPGDFPGISKQGAA